MPFTTIQDRALQIPRQPVPGSQFQRAKFQLGEMRTILPPVGTEIINVQGVDVGPEGKKFQITKELVALIQAGFVRIANDITNPEAHKLGAPLDSPPDSFTPGGDMRASRSDAVSSQNLEGAQTPSIFSSVEEIKACMDREKLRLYVKNKTGFENDKTHIDALRDKAIELFYVK